ncbi:MAG: MFS transporter [Deltaproteobacteria bacterium]|nr:MFS transporter [Deltaproteobacteria bacterium]
MMILGVSSITPAFPKMIQEMNLSPKSIGLLVTLFTLPGVILTPILGVLADRFGRKKVLVPALLSFGLFGGACGLVHDFNLLLALRFLQGAGAASLGVINLTLIGDLYQGQKRAAAMGYNSSVLSLGLTLYPTLGGSLAMLGWHYPFFLPLLALPLGLAVILVLKNPEPKQSQQLKEYLVATLSLFKQRQALGLMAAGVGSFIIIYGPYISFMPIFLADNFQAQPYLIGLVLSSASLTSALVSSQLGRLVKIMPEKVILRTSFLLYVVATAAVPFVPKLWAMVFPSVLLGVAQGTNMPVIQSLMTGLAPSQNRAAFMSIHGMALRGGQTLGPLLMGAVFGWWGLNEVFYAGAILALGLAGLVALAIK